MHIELLVAVLFVVFVLLVSSKRLGRTKKQKSVPSAEEVIEKLTEDLRISIENFLKSKLEVQELRKGDTSVIAALSKFSPEHWDVAIDYIRAGLRFGNAASYVGMAGRCLGFENLLEDFEKQEKHYAELGFIPLPIELFEAWSGFGNSRKAIAAMGVSSERVKRVPLYGAVYRKQFMGEDYPKNSILADALSTGQVTMGNYAQPAPEKAFDNMSPEEKSEVMYEPPKSDQ